MYLAKRTLSRVAYPALPAIWRKNIKTTIKLPKVIEVEDVNVAKLYSLYENSNIF